MRPDVIHASEKAQNKSSDTRVKAKSAKKEKQGNQAKRKSETALQVNDQIDNRNHLKPQHRSIQPSLKIRENKEIAMEKTIVTNKRIIRDSKRKLTHMINQGGQPPLLKRPRGRPPKSGSTKQGTPAATGDKTNGILDRLHCSYL
jgi:hypothetical protein